MTLQLSPEGAASAETALAEARETVAERLKLYGFRNPIVETAGRDRLKIRVIGMNDAQRVRHLLTTRAVFELRFARSPALASPEAVLAHFQGQLPPDLEILQEEVAGENGQKGGMNYYAVEKKPVVTGRDLRSARPGVGSLGDPTVEFQLKPDAAAVFAEATGANIGSQLAIVLDGRVVSAPRINARISDSGVIEGGFTKEQALDLVILLRSDPLPTPLTVVEERIVGRNGA